MLVCLDVIQPLCAVVPADPRGIDPEDDVAEGRAEYPELCGERALGGQCRVW